MLCFWLETARVCLISSGEGRGCDEVYMIAVLSCGVKLQAEHGV